MITDVIFAGSLVLTVLTWMLAQVDELDKFETVVFVLLFGVFWPIGFLVVLPILFIIDAIE